MGEVELKEAIYQIWSDTAGNYIGNEVLDPGVGAVVARFRNSRTCYHESADRAQALVKELNAGGRRRERALREHGFKP